MILISACLAGCKCRYDGRSNPHLVAIQLVEQGLALPVCPEQLGGLKTPRPPAEIAGGHGGDVLDQKARVVNKDGTDVTWEFVRGAWECLRLAKLTRAKLAVLKSQSPSCSVEEVHDGTFSGQVRPGPGVTTALLQQHGFEVLDETDLEQVARRLGPGS
ncbi:MAG: DUF523 domain-containing protein [Bacillota bacterium]